MFTLLPLLPVAPSLALSSSQFHLLFDGKTLLLSPFTHVTPIPFLPNHLCGHQNCLPSPCHTPPLTPLAIFCHPSSVPFSSFLQFSWRSSATPPATLPHAAIPPSPLFSRALPATPPDTSVTFANFFLSFHHTYISKSTLTPSIFLSNSSSKFNLRQLSV